MLLEYFYIYLINPFFLLLDYAYDYIYIKEQENIIEKEKYEYDIDQDKIIITYFTDEGKKFILKVDRKININLKNIINNLKKKSHNDIILGVNYNENDITQQVIKYLGPSGKHIEYYKLLVKDVLTEEQILNFKKLTIINEMCEFNELNRLNEYLL